MWSEVNPKVEDGNLGRNSSAGTKAQVKIGVSNVGSDSPILITNTMMPDKIKEKLGHTPLADACIDATENGLKTIYAFPVKADVKGTVSDITHTGTSTGTFGVKGEPINDFDVVVEITETGDTNEGCFKYSIDGGNNFSDDITIPLSGKYVATETGITFEFEDITTEQTKSFVDGDVYSFSTTAPTMSNASVLKAVEKLQTFNKEVEVCHIVGTSSKTLWAALQSIAKDLMEIYKNPILFLCEARACGNDESIDEYMKSMEDERKGINTLFVCVCASYGIYVRKDLRTQMINMAGVISGIIGQAKESLSIGNVENFPISSGKLIKLIPEGITDGYDKELDAIGYTVIRQYVGKEDFYVANGNVMSPKGSDFSYVENVRVLNRIVRQVCMAASDKIQCEVDPIDLEGSLAPIQAHLNIPIEDCIRDKVVSSGEVTILTDNLNILADETLDVSVEWVPMGTARTFNISFKVNNPARS